MVGKNLEFHKGCGLTGLLNTVPEKIWTMETLADVEVHMDRGRRSHFFSAPNLFDLRCWPRKSNALSFTPAIGIFTVGNTDATLLVGSIHHDSHRCWGIRIRFCGSSSFSAATQPKERMTAATTISSRVVLRSRAVYERVFERRCHLQPRSTAAKLGESVRSVSFVCLSFKP